MNDTDKKRLEEIKAVVRKVQEEDEGSSFLAVPWGVEFLISHLTSALESIQRVRELHTADFIDEYDTEEQCVICILPWPCRTIQALDVRDTEGEGASPIGSGAAAQEVRQ